MGLHPSQHPSQRTADNVDVTTPCGSTIMPWQDNNPTYYAVHELGLIYAQVPKVACTSIRYALAKGAGREIDMRREMIHNRQHFRDAKWTAAGWQPSLLSFGVVRNPWDRLLSLYQHINR